MKRIIALLLVIASVFAFAACKKEEPDELAPFTEALTAAPVSATVASKLVAGEMTLNGKYNVTYADGVATVSYTNEVLGTIPAEGEIPAEKSEVPGTATVGADGAVSAGTIGANYAALIARKITLDRSKMTACSVSGETLVATIAAADATALTAGHANTDVTLNVTVSGGKVMGISVAYGTAAGNLTIVCDYKY